jgi:hypothetical protein
MLVVVGAIERGLHDLGAKIELGAGLAAAQRSFYQAGGEQERAAPRNVPA